MEIHDPDCLALLIIRRSDKPCEIKANTKDERRQQRRQRDQNAAKAKKMRRTSVVKHKPHLGKHKRKCKRVETFPRYSRSASEASDGGNYHGRFLAGPDCIRSTQAYVGTDRRD